MLFAKIAAVLTMVPALVVGATAPGIAQNQNRYADWIYLYEETFENNAGEEITQQLWLNPETSQNGNLLEFTLLARRIPISNNGVAAAVFDYRADCGTLSYAIEATTFLDSSDTTLDTQTYQKVMEPADSETPFYGVLEKLCSGGY